MAQRSVTITHLQYHKKRARGDDKFKDVASLPDGGDLLTFVNAVWNGLGRRTLYDTPKRRSCEPQAAVRRGRSLTLTARTGAYGDPASIRNVETGKEERRHDGELTNGIPVRVVLFVPKRGASALMFIEHVSESVPFGARFLEHLGMCWDQAYPDWKLVTETLTRPSAWLANAELQAVQTRVFRHEVPPEDAGQPKTYGVLKSVLEPPRGSTYFPKGMLERLTKTTLGRAALLGMNEEPDEVKVTLGDGEQQKTFVLGKDKTPSIRMLVTDWSDSALTDDRFRGWCGAEVADLFRAVGAPWDPSMLDGEWSKADLEKKVVLKVDR